MRTRKKSITKHKKIKLLNKKRIKRLNKYSQFIDLVNEVTSQSNNDHRLAMAMKFRADYQASVNEQLEKDLKVMTNRFITTQAMLVCMLSGKEEAQVFKKTDLSEIIEKVNNNDIALKVSQTDKELFFELVYAKENNENETKEEQISEECNKE